MFGVVTKFDFAVSIVSEWMSKGNAYDYVQDLNNDPRPLVCSDCDVFIYVLKKLVVQVLEIARGLNYLHNHKFLHGDLRAVSWRT